MKLKALPKNTFLKKIQSLHSLVTSLSTNHFPQQSADLLPTWFINIYKIESDVVNISNY